MCRYRREGPIPGQPWCPSCYTAEAPHHAELRDTSYGSRPKRFRTDDGAGRAPALAGNAAALITSHSALSSAQRSKPNDLASSASSPSSASAKQAANSSLSGSADRMFRTDLLLVRLVLHVIDGDVIAVVAGLERRHGLVDLGVDRARPGGDDPGRHVGAAGRAGRPRVPAPGRRTARGEQQARDGAGRRGRPLSAGDLRAGSSGYRRHGSLLVAAGITSKNLVIVSNPRHLR